MIFIWHDKEEFMRLRNVKNKREILEQSPYFVTNPQDKKGKWNLEFGNDHPIYLEIGMGKGKFLRELAQKHPEINFIGMERSDSILAKAVPKIMENATNIRVLQYDASLIDDLFDREISRIYLNFSDPWPKKRHARRRLMATIFLRKYDHIFKDHKEIHMKTDNRELFEFALESLSQYGYRFEQVLLDLHHSGLEDNITTEYEEKFMKENKTIYQCIATKDKVN